MNRQNSARSAQAAGPASASGKASASHSPGVSAGRESGRGIKSAVPVIGNVRVFDKPEAGRKQKIGIAGPGMPSGIAACGKMKDGAKSVSGIPAQSLEIEKRQGKCSSLTGKCFPAGTVIYTRQGYRPIQDIQRGDDIYARNVQTQETGLKKVTDVFQTEAHTIYQIWLDSSEKLEMTAYHPVFVKGKGWVNAIQLREGDVAETFKEPAAITKISKIRCREPVAVYSFHVEDWESYFVSEKRVYVHNGSGHAEQSPRKIQSIGDLTDAQKKAIQKYTGDDYENINASLRGMDKLHPDNVETVETMKEALGNSSLPEDMTLYRGTSTAALGSLRNLPPEEMVGKTFTEKGFMSTSKDPAVAEGFYSDMIMTVEAPKGSHALDIAPISEYDTESEVLFNAGQEMVITSAAEDDNGVLHITVIPK